MKVAVICLSYGREELTARSLAHNLNNACMEFGLFVVSKKGIARAMNHGLHKAYNKGYDAFCFLANDILEPKEWLKQRVYSLHYMRERGIKPGMVAIPFQEVFADYKITDVIANVLITREVVDKVGYFNEGLGEYGPVDCDYNHRCAIAGFSNYYLPLQQVVELDKSQDDSTDRIYGYSKREAIQAVWGQHSAEVTGYLTGTRDIYITYPEYTINMNEYE